MMTWYKRKLMISTRCIWPLVSHGTILRGLSTRNFENRAIYYLAPIILVKFCYHSHPSKGAKPICCYFSTRSSKILTRALCIRSSMPISHQKSWTDWTLKVMYRKRENLKNTTVKLLLDGGKKIPFVIKWKVKIALLCPQTWAKMLN